MKLSTRYTILTALALTILVSCKPMPESERLIPNEMETTKGRAVLIEDYSGVLCINCPKAANGITKAAEAYGDKVVIVALHGSTTDVGTPPEEDPKGLYSPEAATYFERLQAGGSLPVATFNRRSLASSGGKTYSDSYTQWPAVMQSVRELPQLYKIDLQVSESDRKVTTRCTATALEQTEAATAPELYLQLWLIEDNIVAPQHISTKVINDFQHNHIFRQTLNGIDGEAYQLGQNYDKTSAIEREVVNPDHCAVVAILYDHKTGEVYEVAKAELHPAPATK
ncbi:Omp28 family outer membrane lipoprotein [uncultured Porphyromonas sp.]|uniref:Omp28 family outer membrane lipoprotein n=1 Tax=uncultured Porphyromonas sp. TaxID=159274 RepID=UPI00262867A7|nr:Omp28 family outer membrane lipoprotein [uncultured Porphyromonas sp.]